MTFDPMKFYDDGQRKQKRYDSLVPVFVVAIVLLVVFGAAFVAYQRSHVKPKPEQWAYQGRPCKGTDCREAIAADEAFAPQCSGGQYVTDLKDCPEYRQAGVDDYNPHAHVTLKSLKDAQGQGQACILAINSECWIMLDPETKPRKHKRKAAADHLFWVTTGSFRSPYDYQWRFVNTIPMEITCSKLTGIMHGECESRPLTPAEIEQYKPIAEKKKPDCPAAPDGDGDYYVDSDGCLRVSFTPMPAACGADEKCRWSVAHVTPDKPVTTPQDITNLMEQIAPTAKQERKPCPGGCDDGWDVEENAYACVQDGLMQPPSQKSCAELGQKPAKWPTSATAQIVLTQKQKNAYPANAWMKTCGPDNHADGCYTPDCKMPADVDVCPTQTLESKGISDKGVDLKKYGVRDGKDKP